MQIGFHLRIARDIQNQAYAMVADQVRHIGGHGNPEAHARVAALAQQDYGLQCRQSQSTGCGAADLTAARPPRPAPRMATLVRSEGSILTCSILGNYDPRNLRKNYWGTSGLSGYLVCFVCLVNLVHRLVSFNRKTKQTKQTG